ncbi:MAG: MFS transporter [Xanthomonadales bacterium]|nr:Lysophospholipid transporter LplT [Xanthomonadales bacterium]MCC6594016.1 MFS transporter [Xanthomonadales bacterium]MCE7932568.1 MFS transporter [Xanthomonadales bacterium PRO6]
MSSHSQFGLLTQRRFLPFFLTQSLGAFNDNVFKQGFVALVVFVGALDVGMPAASFSLLAGALFIAPFFLFSALGGQLADKYDKARLARWIKALELLLMLLACAGFLLKSAPLLLGVLFLLGLQASLFGPLKYGILPQVLSEAELTGGNGLVESATMVSILLGTLLGTTLAGIAGDGLVFLSMVGVGTALVGWFAALAMPPSPAVSPALTINFNPLSETWRSLKFLAGNRTVFLSCLGISWFWFYGSMYFLILPVYVRDVVGGATPVYTLMLALFSVGTGVGALLCELLSRRKVEIGLVPFGSIGMTVFGLDLYFALPAASGQHELSIAAFLATGYGWRLVIDLVLMAIFSGFFIVPLFALIQQRSEPGHRSRVIGANNILNAAFMVAASLLGFALLNGIGLTLPQVLLVTALCNAVVAIYIYTLVPEFLLRFVAWILINVLYRLRVRGVEQVPDEGAALLVCNHVSYVDALVIMGLVPRPIRFVMYYKIFEMPVAKQLFRWAKAIPIAGAKEDPAVMQRAFEEVSRELRDGHLVCIFPEGGLTRDGEIARFRPGMERILERDPVPVIPMALQGLWGSVFSRRDRGLGPLKLPRRFWSRVGLAIGAPRTPSEARAEVMEQDVRALRGELA